MVVVMPIVQPGEPTPEPPTDDELIAEAHANADRRWEEGLPAHNDEELPKDDATPDETPPPAAMWPNEPVRYPTGAFNWLNPFSKRGAHHAH